MFQEKNQLGPIYYTFFFKLSTTEFILNLVSKISFWWISRYLLYSSRELSYTVALFSFVLTFWGFRLLNWFKSLYSENKIEYFDVSKRKTIEFFKFCNIHKISICCCRLDLTYYIFWMLFFFIVLSNSEVSSNF